ncbi:hypothetical protein ASC77_21605 [Nocardioides sp. Root1257]|uniref:hypothetical protein n=1 Tax=unclassified Nocardioides TaxID=2615069 RepID=UPI0006F96AAE|nr:MULTISPECIES: hypothetical protein [unclassified Nocardioides]KQW43992.1 hypothetical protein ASC77_21605 [Nocardioides sp. Root1257]KRC42433.1 hypothetical protein ASE24_21400 [Nocardioides sp. Root224]
MTDTRLTPASPWPFVGMAGMACAFFLYAASGLIVPWWAVVLLLGVWVALFAVACAWWTLHPTRLPWVAVLALVVWVAAIWLVGLAT